jgi:ribonuclease Y
VETEAEAARIRVAAEMEARTLLHDGDIAAREEALAARLSADEAFRRQDAEIALRAADLRVREAAIESRERLLTDRRTRLAERATPIAAAEGAGNKHRQAATVALGEVRLGLERACGQTAAALRRVLMDAEIEEARAQAANMLRAIAESVNDPLHVREAHRTMAVAGQRFSGHYLTERRLSTVFIGPPRPGKPVIGEPELRAIEGVTGITLSFGDALDTVRIDGLDGVAREVARRCLATLVRRPMFMSSSDAVTKLAKETADRLGREVRDLGRRAFAILEIPPAHPEIMKLVGRLNYRTSYTQNQWKHAVEASFLCGMMAAELGLDRRIAVRAALMHDIGKALTHELDGSHAVIGADYARRLGEAEVVANAIGAHHTDEPFDSPYAYLVAAADAMSGARPGARRQMEASYSEKLDDLVRISRQFPDVQEAFAVQGGREVRVYVREDRVDDQAAVRLSSEIADTISRQMTFPGQIRVTVIREFKAVETAN